MHGRRQVAPVVVQLAHVPHEVQRQSRREPVDGAAHRRQAVLRPQGVDAPAKRLTEQLGDAREGAGGRALGAGPGRLHPEAPRRRVGTRDQRPHERRRQRDGDLELLPQHDLGRPHREVADDDVGLPLLDQRLEVGELVGDRLDKPVAEGRQQPPAAAPAGAEAAFDRRNRVPRPPFVEAREAEHGQVLLLEHAPGAFAGVERDVVTTVAERAGDRDLPEDVAGQRPAGEEETRHG